MEDQGVISLPHPLYHLLAILTKNLLVIDYAKASTFIIALAIFLLASLNYNILKKHNSAKVSVFFSICLLLITPIQALYPVDKHLYFGYIGISVYHSPTMLLLKPLALIAFLYTLKTLNSTSKDDLPNALAYASILFICGLSKPNFLIIILPAFFLSLALTQKLKSTLKTPYIYGAFLLPILTVLTLQFLHTYFYQKLSHEPGTESHLVFLPFASMSHYSDFLVAKLFLSIAFPLSVFLFFPKAFIREKALLLSSTCLLIGLAFTYFFAESGYRMFSGNFWWSAQIGLYLIFLFSLKFLLENTKNLTTNKTKKLKFAICLLLFFAHTACGIFYYKQELLFEYAKFW
ncbi:hypothetical protein D9M71_300680 [compost metagenome]